MMHPPACHHDALPGHDTLACDVWLFTTTEAQAEMTAHRSKAWPRARRTALTRWCIARTVGTTAFELGHADDGAPTLRCADALHGDVALSLSHTRGALAVAILHGRGARDGMVGVDIEPTLGKVLSSDPLPWLARDEAAALQSASSADRRRQWISIWTQKEALIKAWGGGLARHRLDRFAVETDADAPAALRWSGGGQPTLWLERLRAPGIVGALACRHRPWRTRSLHVPLNMFPLLEATGDTCHA